MTDMELMEEYGVSPPLREVCDSEEEYVLAYNVWLVGFESYKLGRLQAEEDAAAQPDEAGESGGEEEQPKEEEEAGEMQEPEAAPEFVPFVEEDLETEDRYPVGSYVDEAGNVWSQEGELLSPGTTPAMEPVEVAGEPVTGDPTIDTALLLLDLLDALTGEEGMSSDVDSIQQAVDVVRQTVDHPLMTTSFQDYTVTEGLLLLLLLSAFVAACARMLKEGFSWLR